MNAKTKKRHPSRDTKPLPNMLTLDTVLPTQLITPVEERALRQRGEFQLLLAVLEDAIHCFTTYLLAKRLHDRRLFQEAEKWINLQDDRWFFSFNNVCLALNIHPDRLRAELNKWKERQLTRQKEGTKEKASMQLAHKKPRPAASQGAQNEAEEVTAMRKFRKETSLHKENMLQ